MDFSQIVLTTDERKALEILQKDSILFGDDKKADAALMRLVRLEFAEKLVSPYEGKVSYIIRGTGRGADYLMYRKRVSHKERVEWIRYIVTTVIAIVAIILAGISLASELGLILLQ